MTLLGAGADCQVSCVVGSQRVCRIVTLLGMGTGDVSLTTAAADGSRCDLFVVVCGATTGIGASCGAFIVIVVVVSLTDLSVIHL